MMPVDPAVAPTEELLRSNAEPRDANDLLANPEEARHAMWLCCCYQEGDAPTWLLFETPEGGLGWCRVPDGIQEKQLVRSRQWAGAHTNAQGVLSWVRGTAPDPWVDSYGSSAVHLRIFTRLLRATPGS